MKDVEQAEAFWEQARKARIELDREYMEAPCDGEWEILEELHEARGSPPR